MYTANASLNPFPLSVKVAFHFQHKFNKVSVDGIESFLNIKLHDETSNHGDSPEIYGFISNPYSICDLSIVDKSHLVFYNCFFQCGLESGSQCFCYDFV
ncbi:hypothetical protein IC582_013644 [Cucumis melo]